MPESTSHNKKERLFPIRLPDFEDGRQFQEAWLVLPIKFPQEGLAHIRLSSDAVLRLPHVESNGKLCIEGDSEPGSGNTAEQRLNELLDKFYLNFLNPWCAGDLDGNFEREALSYWAIRVNKLSSPNDAVTRIYTVDTRHPMPRVYKAKLFLPGRIVIAGDNPLLTKRFAMSLGHKARQECNALIADIPISHELTPLTWPRTQPELERLVEARLNENLRNEFRRNINHRKRPLHRIVLLRSPHCNFGFLLTGGPPTPVKKGIRVRAFTTRQMLPLSVHRIDPLWTCGREQHPQIKDRLQQHVLVFGAGALGSFVIDQLAKAGVGHISVVDPDSISTANIGRHLLGAESLGSKKVHALVQCIELSNPAVKLDHYANYAQDWITKHTLRGIDLIIDLTGESEVRWCLEQARILDPKPLLIGWMEPYVAAAHACMLPAGERWMHSECDPLESLQSVEWPHDVIQREPACSSNFQSYTPSAAAHAVALVTEAALALIDNQIDKPIIRSWIRGQRFLDAHYPGLIHRDWAKDATPFDGLSLERDWP